MGLPLARRADRARDADRRPGDRRRRCAAAAPAVAAARISLDLDPRLRRRRPCTDLLDAVDRSHGQLTHPGRAPTAGRMEAVRRLLLLTSAIIFLDVAFYAAISPLLPQYADDLDLNKAQAGILAASYAAGTMLASLPAGYVAARVGPRRTVIGGLLLLGASSLAFGFADQYGFLASARFIQGISSALTWSGAFTWLVTSVGPDRRGAVIGTTIGTAVFGALFGPPIGALATAIGTEPVFGSVLAITLAMAWAAARIPGATETGGGPPPTLAAALARAPVMASPAVVPGPPLKVREDSVPVPPRVGRPGGRPGLIGAGFTGA